MKFILSILSGFVGFLLVAVVIAAPSSDNDGLKKQEIENVLSTHPNLISFGSYGGKMFFTDSTVVRDFGNSCSFCQRIGMKLATVDSPGEFNHLIGILPTAHRYYTSAQSTVNYEWSEGHKVSIAFQYSYAPACLQISNKVLNSVTCTTTSVSYPLCQTF